MELKEQIEKAAVTRNQSFFLANEFRIGAEFGYNKAIELVRSLAEENKDWALVDLATYLEKKI